MLTRSSDFVPDPSSLGNLVTDGGGECNWTVKTRDFTYVVYARCARADDMLITVRRHSGWRDKNGRVLFSVYGQHWGTMLARYALEAFGAVRANNMHLRRWLLLNGVSAEVETRKSATVLLEVAAVMA